MLADFIAKEAGRSEWNLFKNRTKYRRLGSLGGRLQDKSLACRKLLEECLKANISGREGKKKKVDPPPKGET